MISNRPARVNLTDHVTSSVERSLSSPAVCHLQSPQKLVLRYTKRLPTPQPPAAGSLFHEQWSTYSPDIWTFISRLANYCVHSLLCHTIRPYCMYDRWTVKCQTFFPIKQKHYVSVCVCFSCKDCLKPVCKVAWDEWHVPFISFCCCWCCLFVCLFICFLSFDHFLSTNQNNHIFEYRPT